MPELPEVETVRRTLGRVVIGCRVARVRLQREDVVRGLTGPGDLLVGDRITQIRRHGKQLALIGRTGRLVCVHLGMSGRLGWDEGTRGRKSQARHGQTWANADSQSVAGIPVHTHVMWHFTGGGTLSFNDPRRFGGIWCLAGQTQLMERRWGNLGADALGITPGQLHRHFQRTTRAVKAALLDQAVVAGLGNIYVDELLFASRLHPLTPANALTLGQVQAMVRSMRRLLSQAIDAGGSTVRSYVNAHGWAGGFQHRHRVYGRANEPCRRCRSVLQMTTVAGRTTTWCVWCQPCGITTD